MIAEGKYQAVPTEACLAITGTGSEQIAVRFDIIDMPGTSVTWYGFFTDATFDRTIESLRACGWTGSDLDDFAFGSPLPAEFCNQVQVVIEHEEGNDGITRAKVRWVNSAGGLSVKNPIDAVQAKTFAARMRGRIIALDSSKGITPKKAQPKPAVKAAPAQDFDDSNIPF